MILGFKQRFPDGSPTNFKEQILDDTKIHTIRAGNRWRKGLSIQMATGVRTKQYRQFNIDRPDLQVCKNVQDIFMTYDCRLRITVAEVDSYMGGDDFELNGKQLIQLAVNDGFPDYSVFDRFFYNGIKKNEKLTGNAWLSGQIVHWTEFKY